MPPIRTNELVRNFKCSSCSKYLTVPPITLDSNGGNYCGREQCVSDGNRRNLYRNTLYEMAAKTFQFPCSHDGCVRKIRFNDKHEESCEYRRVDCPANHVSQTKACYWTGYYGKEMMQHFKDNHSDVTIKTPMLISKIRIGEMRFLTFFNNSIFLIRTKIDGNIFYHGVYYYGGTKPTLKYKLTAISSKDWEFSKNYEMNSIDDIKEWNFSNLKDFSKFFNNPGGTSYKISICYN